MGALRSLLAGKLVAFDSAPVIYYIEEHPDYLPIVNELFDIFDLGVATGITSVLTLHEVLVKPLRDGRFDLAEKYRTILSNSANVTVHVIDPSICQRAAILRANYPWMRAPDALQIGTAIDVGAHTIVTNDTRWVKLTEIEVVVLRELI